MKLSKKKTDELYSVIHEAIMKARVQLADVTSNPNRSMYDVYNEVDEIMSKLCYECPEQAIKLFEK